MITVSDKFHQLAAASVRPLDWDVAISFTKKRNSGIKWFTLDQSTLDGADLLGSSDQNPIQLWDAYDYMFLKERLVSMNFSRSVEFPYNIQSCIADFELNNYDKRFSFGEDGSASPIGKYILPKRPCRLYMGFKGGGLAPVFVGLTQGLPTYDGNLDEVVSFTAMDFLSEIGEMSLKNMVMMRNVRTDQVIATILNQFGLDPAMYKLSAGLNVIPFVYFASGKNAGNALKELVQAENGAMWLDEQGIIRFQPRTSIIGKQPVMTFNATTIIKATPSRTDSIVNTVKVKSEIRAVQAFQSIFTMDNSNGYSGESKEDAYRLPANSTKDVWISFDDPIWQCSTNPVLKGSSDNSNFTTVDLFGKSVSEKVSATGTLFADSMKLTFINTNSFPVSVNFLQIFGEPAKQVSGSPIEYEAHDSESVEKYGVQALEINDNDCFGNYKNIDGYATDILKKYANYSPILKLEVKGNPALQLQDIVSVDYKEFVGNYQIIGIEMSLGDSQLKTTLTLKKTTVISPFILDQSVLDGTDVLG